MSFVRNVRVSKFGGNMILNRLTLLAITVISLLCGGMSVRAADFNGDGKADILFHQDATGRNFIMLMSGRKLIGKGAVPRLKPSWNAVGFGDFDGDGKSDIFFRQAETGKNFIMQMNGRMVLSKGAAPAIHKSWSFAGTGDFDGNGTSDVLFRQAATGKNYIMLMNGRRVLSKGPVMALGKSWDVAGTGDFNGDGKADILFHQAATGKNYILLMNGRTVLGKGGTRALAKPWRIVGTGDYNGDGRADILFRHPSTGKNIIFLMNGRRLVSKGRLMAMSATWHVVEGRYLPFIILRGFGVSPDPRTSSVVNVMFHAQRGDTFKSIRNLTVNDVLATQDNLPIAIAESFLEVRPVTNFPTTIKTVLLLDTSGSVYAAGGIRSLKAAAKAAIAGMSSGQQMAIYLLDQVPAKLLQGYTSNRTVLNKAVDSIGVTVPVGGPTTNLYGALDSALRSWTTSFSQSGITYGNAILVTDGNDTAGIQPLSTVLGLINSAQKPVYTVGIGAGINWATMKKISAYGKVFKSRNFKALTSTMKSVNNAIFDYTKGLYMAYYASPSRAGVHTLELRLRRNSNTAPLTSRVFGNFDATGFTNPLPVLEISGPTSIPVGGSIRLRSRLRWSLFQPPVTWRKGVDPTNDMQLTSVGATAKLKSLNGSGKVIRVTASDTMGHSAFKDITLEPDYRLSGLKATPGDGQVTLSWTSPLAGTPSVRIFYGTTRTVSKKSPYLTGSGGSYIHAGLTNGTTYFYRLAVVKPNGGLGPLTKIISARPMIPRPTGLTATAGDGVVSLSWSAVAGATYELFWSTTPKVTTASNKIPVTGPSYTHTGLQNRTFYYYRVRAVKAGGASWLSKMVKARPMVPTPTGLTATAGNGQVSLSWSPVAGATYELFWSTTPKVTVASNKIPLTTTSYTHTGLFIGRTYYYAVRAVKNGKASRLSSVVQATPSLATPTGLQAVSDSGQVTLSWSQVPGAQYQIFWSTTPKVTAKSNMIGASKIGTATSYTHRGLTNGVTYYYAVRAVMRGGA
ncbi:MAG: VWA domain-containing protein, partial [Gammaproteobacteria bacterium]